LKAYVDQWLGQRLANGSVRQQLERWVAFAWNLEPLRQAIDQRLLLAPAVARAKWNVQAPIEDLPREAQVIAAAVRQGHALGLPDAWVEAVFKAQIEASKTVQRELYAQWRREQAGHFSDAPDLANTIRPELDRITTQLLRAMADNQAVLKSAASSMRPLDAVALSPTAAAQALAPFANPIALCLFGNTICCSRNPHLTVRISHHPKLVAIWKNSAYDEDITRPKQRLRHNHYDAPRAPFRVDPKRTTSAARRDSPVHGVGGQLV